MHVQNHTPLTTLLLTDLAGCIREYQEGVDRYLRKVRDDGSAHVLWPIALHRVPYPWKNHQSDLRLEELRTSIGTCPVIQLSDVDSIENAADFWDGLLTDVIRPLDMRCYEFLFHWRNVSRRLVLEIDEMADVIAAYPTYGRVSLLMEEQEALALYNRLYGGGHGNRLTGSRLPDVREQYQLLYLALRVDVLLIHSHNRVLLYSKDGVTDFVNSLYFDRSAGTNSLDRFLAGYRLGLLLHLAIAPAVLLGQALSGLWPAADAVTGSQALLAYIDAWVASYS